MQDWLAGLVGEDLAPILFVLLAALFVAGLAVVVIRLLRGVLTGGIGGLRNVEGPRVEVMDVTAVDPKRKLVLVRRDQVEHLILIGGANDLVVESRIGRPAPPPARRAEPSAGFAPAPQARREPRPVEPMNETPEAPFRAPAEPAQPVRSAVDASRAEPAPAPAVRAPQPQMQPRQQATAPVVPAPPVRMTEESGRRVEPVLDAPEAPRVQPAEPASARTASPQGPRSDTRSGEHSGERPGAVERFGSPSSQNPAVPAVAPAIDRTPVGPSSPVPPSRSIAQPVSAPPVAADARAGAPERRPSSAPQPRASVETPKASEPVASPSSGRQPPVEWPVRDKVDAPLPERPSATQGAAPSAPAKVGAPASPNPASAEERPLVVRSFASTISERRSGPVMPAPPMVASPPPAPSQEAGDLDLDDDLLADLTRQLEMPDEPDAPEPSASDRSEDAAPGVPARRELSLEDEMQRLLRDFSAHADRR